MIGAGTSTEIGGPVLDLIVGGDRLRDATGKTPRTRKIRPGTEHNTSTIRQKSRSNGSTHDGGPSPEASMRALRHTFRGPASVGEVLLAAVPPRGLDHGEGRSDDEAEAVRTRDAGAALLSRTTELLQQKATEAVAVPAALMHDQTVSPSVRSASARTVLEIVFRAGELEVKEPSGAIERQRTVDAGTAEERERRP